MSLAADKAAGQGFLSDRQKLISINPFQGCISQQRWRSSIGGSGAVDLPQFRLAAGPFRAYRRSPMRYQMFDARQVANFLLDYADQRRVKLSNMALLKHIYFAHGWHLASRNEPLVSNRIEAWQHGPVIRAVYDSFKHFEASPIASRAMMIDLRTGEVAEAKGIFLPETEDLLKSTLDYYSSYGAFELSEMTHSKGSPWDQVWNAGDGRVRLNMEIPNASIQSYFVKQAKSVSIQ